MKRVKRLKTNNDGVEDDDIPIFPNPVLDDDSVCKILSKLPVKTLMRFKWVCKSWQSLIQSDTHFVDLHFTESKKRPFLLLITYYGQDGKIIPDGNELYSVDLSKVIIDGGGGAGAGAATYITTAPCAHAMLQIVNGLVCFVNYKEKTVLIYNLSTREKTQWIKTPVEGQQKGRYHHPPWYGFGFDPAINKHKVICITLKDGKDNESNPNYQVCDVLTLGQKSWTRIAAVPPLNISGNSFYVNGTMYWPSVVEYQRAIEYSIVAFDIVSEKFRAIQVPKHNEFFGIDIPLPIERFTGYDFGYMEVNERLALPVYDHRVDSKTVCIWIYDDVKEEQMKENTSSGNWTEETIYPLPYDPKQEYLCTRTSIAGTDLIMLVTIKRNDPDTFPSIYYYDWRKKSTTTHHRCDVKTRLDGHSVFVESLFHVQPLTTGQQEPGI